jgi:phenylpropionate dioxygenase-like ring-hydroxylating dioxygenase large terminal subunit
LERPWLEAENLPPEVYYSREIYDLEIERIFRREWLCVGRTEDIPRPGDFFTEEVAGQPVIVIRDNEHEVHALLNVCRHRGSPLVLEEKGCVKSIRCPYHGWMYGLDGTLRAAPEFKAVKDFHKRDYRLRSARVELWNEFVMINLDADATPFTGRLRGTEVWGVEKDEQRTVGLTPCRRTGSSCVRTTLMSTTSLGYTPRHSRRGPR